jgi:hypothetical protein
MTFRSSKSREVAGGNEGSPRDTFEEPNRFFRELPYAYGLPNQNDLKITGVVDLVSVREDLDSLKRESWLSS